MSWRDFNASASRIAHWAYVQTERAGGMTWLRGDDLHPLLPEWRNYLDPTIRE
jgi:hypothetical protein